MARLQPGISRTRTLGSIGEESQSRPQQDLRFFHRASTFSSALSEGDFSFAYLNPSGRGSLSANKTPVKSPLARDRAAYTSPGQENTPVRFQNPQFNHPYGEAAEYYGDQGQSIQAQPGMRPHTPILEGTEPHLLAPLSEPRPPVEPSSMGLTGAAADFYGQAPSNSAPNTPFGHTALPAPQQPPTHPVTQAPPGPHPFGPANPAPEYTQPFTGQHGAESHPSYGIGPIAYDQNWEDDAPHTSSPNAGNNHINQNGLPGLPSAGAQFGTVPYHCPHGTASAPPPLIYPGHPIQPHPPYSRPQLFVNTQLQPSQALQQYPPQYQQSPSSELTFMHSPQSPTRRHRTPFRWFVDFLKDKEGVGQYEDYSQAVGICKYCFDEGTTSKMAPRKHNYQRTLMLKKREREQKMSRNPANMTRIGKNRYHQRNTSSSSYSSISSNDNSKPNRHLTSSKGKAALAAVVGATAGAELHDRALQGRRNSVTDAASLGSESESDSGFKEGQAQDRTDGHLTTDSERGGYSSSSSRAPSSRASPIARSRHRRRASSNHGSRSPSSRKSASSSRTSSRSPSSARRIKARRSKRSGWLNFWGGQNASHSGTSSRISSGSLSSLDSGLAFGDIYVPGEQPETPPKQKQRNVNDRLRALRESAMALAAADEADEPRVRSSKGSGQRSPLSSAATRNRISKPRSLLALKQGNPPTKATASLRSTSKPTGALQDHDADDGWEDVDSEEGSSAAEESSDDGQSQTMTYGDGRKTYDYKYMHSPSHSSAEQDSDAQSSSTDSQGHGWWPWGSSSSRKRRSRRRRASSSRSSRKGISMRSRSSAGSLTDNGYDDRAVNGGESRYKPQQDLGGSGGLATSEDETSQSAIQPLTVVLPLPTADPREFDVTTPNPTLKPEIPKIPEPPEKQEPSAKRSETPVQESQGLLQEKRNTAKTDAYERAASNLEKSSSYPRHVSQMADLHISDTKPATHTSDDDYRSAKNEFEGDHGSHVDEHPPSRQSGQVHFELTEEQERNARRRVEIEEQNEQRQRQREIEEAARRREQGIDDMDNGDVPLSHADFSPPRINLPEHTPYDPFVSGQTPEPSRPQEPSEMHHLSPFDPRAMDLNSHLSHGTTLVNPVAQRHHESPQDPPQLRGGANERSHPDREVPQHTDLTTTAEDWVTDSEGDDQTHASHSDAPNDLMLSSSTHDAPFDPFPQDVSEAHRVPGRNESRRTSPGGQSSDVSYHPQESGDGPISPAQIDIMAPAEAEDHDSKHDESEEAHGVDTPLVDQTSEGEPSQSRHHFPRDNNPERADNEEVEAIGYEHRAGQHFSEHNSPKDTSKDDTSEAGFVEDSPMIHPFEDQSPEYGDTNQPTSPSTKIKPRSLNEWEFAAALAAGTDLAGFDSNIVTDNLRYREGRKGSDAQESDQIEPFPDFEHKSLSSVPDENSRMDGDNMLHSEQVGPKEESHPVSHGIEADNEAVSPAVSHDTMQTQQENHSFDRTQELPVDGSRDNSPQGLDMKGVTDPAEKPSEKSLGDIDARQGIDHNLEQESIPNPLNSHVNDRSMSSQSSSPSVPEKDKGRGTDSDTVEIPEARVASRPDEPSSAEAGSLSPTPDDPLESYSGDAPLTADLAKSEADELQANDGPMTAVLGAANDVPKTEDEGQANETSFSPFELQQEEDVFFQPTSEKALSPFMRRVTGKDVVSGSKAFGEENETGRLAFPELSTADGELDDGTVSGDLEKDSPTTELKRNDSQPHGSGADQMKASVGDQSLFPHASYGNDDDDSTSGVDGKISDQDIQTSKGKPAFPGARLIDENSNDTNEIDGDEDDDTVVSFFSMTEGPSSEEQNDATRQIRSRQEQENDLPDHNMPGSPRVSESGQSDITVRIHSPKPLDDSLEALQENSSYESEKVEAMEHAPRASPHQPDDGEAKADVTGFTPSEFFLDAKDTSQVETGLEHLEATEMSHSQPMEQVQPPMSIEPSKNEELTPIPEVTPSIDNDEEYQEDDHQRHVSDNAEVLGHEQSSTEETGLSSPVDVKQKPAEEANPKTPDQSVSSEALMKTEAAQKGFETQGHTGDVSVNQIMTSDEDEPANTPSEKGEPAGPDTDNGVSDAHDSVSEKSTKAHEKNLDSVDLDTNLENRGGDAMNDSVTGSQSVPAAKSLNHETQSVPGEPKEHAPLTEDLSTPKRLSLSFQDMNPSAQETSETKRDTQHASDVNEGEPLRGRRPRAESTSSRVSNSSTSTVNRLTSKHLKGLQFMKRGLSQSRPSVAVSAASGAGTFYEPSSAASEEPIDWERLNKLAQQHKTRSRTGSMRSRASTVSTHPDKRPSLGEGSIIAPSPRKNTTIPTFAVTSYTDKNSDVKNDALADNDVHVQEPPPKIPTVPTEETLANRHQLQTQASGLKPPNGELAAGNPEITDFCPPSTGLESKITETPQRSADETLAAQRSGLPDLLSIAANTPLPPDEQEHDGVLQTTDSEVTEDSPHFINSKAELGLRGGESSYVNPPVEDQGVDKAEDIVGGSEPHKSLPGNLEGTAGIHHSDESKYDIAAGTGESHTHQASSTDQPLIKSDGIILSETGGTESAADCLDIAINTPLPDDGEDFKDCTNPLNPIIRKNSDVSSELSSSEQGEETNAASVVSHTLEPSTGLPELVNLATSTTRPDEASDAVNLETHDLPNITDIAANTPLPEDDEADDTEWSSRESDISLIADVTKTASNTPLAEDNDTHATDLIHQKAEELPLLSETTKIATSVPLPKDEEVNTIAAEPNLPSDVTEIAASIPLPDEENDAHTTDSSQYELESHAYSNDSEIAARVLLPADENKIDATDSSHLEAACHRPADDTEFAASVPLPHSEDEASDTDLSDHEGELQKYTDFAASIPLPESEDEASDTDSRDDNAKLQEHTDFAASIPLPESGDEASDTDLSDDKAELQEITDFAVNIPLPESEDEALDTDSSDPRAEFLEITDFAANIPLPESEDEASDTDLSDHKAGLQVNTDLAASIPLPESKDEASDTDLHNDKAEFQGDTDCAASIPLPESENEASDTDSSHPNAELLGNTAFAASIPLPESEDENLDSNCNHREAEVSENTDLASSIALLESNDGHQNMSQSHREDTNSLSDLTKLAASVPLPEDTGETWDTDLVNPEARDSDNTEPAASGSSPRKQGNENNVNQFHHEESDPLADLTEFAASIPLPEDEEETFSTNSAHHELGHQSHIDNADTAVDVPLASAEEGTIKPTRDIANEDVEHDDAASGTTMVQELEFKPSDVVPEITTPCDTVVVQSDSPEPIGYRQLDETTDPAKDVLASAAGTPLPDQTKHELTELQTSHSQDNRPPVSAESNTSSLPPLNRTKRSTGSPAKSASSDEGIVSGSSQDGSERGRRSSPRVSSAFSALLPRFRSATSATPASSPLMKDPARSLSLGGQTQPAGDDNMLSVKNLFSSSRRGKSEIGRDRTTSSKPETSWSDDQNPARSIDSDGHSRIPAEHIKPPSDNEDTLNVEQSQEAVANAEEVAPHDGKDPGPEKSLSKSGPDTKLKPSNSKIPLLKLDTQFATQDSTVDQGPSIAQDRDDIVTPVTSVTKRRWWRPQEKGFFTRVLDTIGIASEEKGEWMEEITATTQNVPPKSPSALEAQSSPQASDAHDTKADSGQLDEITENGQNDAQLGEADTERGHADSVETYILSSPEQPDKAVASSTSEHTIESGAGSSILWNIRHLYEGSQPVDKDNDPENDDGEAPAGDETQGFAQTVDPNPDLSSSKLARETPLPDEDEAEVNFLNESSDLSQEQNQLPESAEKTSNHKSTEYASTEESATSANDRSPLPDGKEGLDTSKSPSESRVSLNTSESSQKDSDSGTFRPLPKAKRTPKFEHLLGQLPKIQPYSPMDQSSVSGQKHKQSDHTPIESFDNRSSDITALSTPVARAGHTPAEHTESIARSKTAHSRDVITRTSLEDVFSQRSKAETAKNWEIKVPKRPRSDQTFDSKRDQGSLTLQGHGHVASPSSSLDVPNRRSSRSSPADRLLRRINRSNSLRARQLADYEKPHVASRARAATGPFARGTSLENAAWPSAARHPIGLGGQVEPTPTDISRQREVNDEGYNSPDLEDETVEEIFVSDSSVTCNNFHASYSTFISSCVRSLIMVVAVQEGIGRTAPGSPHSPSRPSRPSSIRQRQSIERCQVLESRIEELSGQNKELVTRGIEQDRQRQESLTARRQAEKQAHSRGLELQFRDLEIQRLKSQIGYYGTEYEKLKDTNEGLTTQVSELTNQVTELTSERNAIDEQYKTEKEQRQRIDEDYEHLKADHAQLSSKFEELNEQTEQAVQEKTAEIQQLRDQLAVSKTKVKELQKKITEGIKDDGVILRDKEFFEQGCQKLCQHIKQWAVRFSKHSDKRVCRTTAEVHDPGIIKRFRSIILDESDVDEFLADRIRRRDAFMAVISSMIYENVFNRYLFGMDRDQRKQIKALERKLLEVGPRRAVQKWRSITLSILVKHVAFEKQRKEAIDSTAQDIYHTLSRLLPPPADKQATIIESLKALVRVAVDIATEMRLQRAEYAMLRPFQQKLDETGQVADKYYFDASIMNDASPDKTLTNDQLEQEQAVVRLVLFPMIVKKTNDDGDEDDEVVISPAQVLVATEQAKDKRAMRVASSSQSLSTSRSKPSVYSSMEDIR
ncbi:hypothetical protein KEM56_001324 [Ascosphaera pollenicola]|nr:hypothetical protein KEM56_001324 [Ascosphaera pollenicola]